MKRSCTFMLPIHFVMKRKISIEIISFLFILLFLYASLSKAFDYRAFVVQVGQSPILTGFGRIIPWLIISIEFVLVIILMIPRLRLIGFCLSFSIMVMFTAYIIAILRFSNYVPCSCGGVLARMGWSEHLVFNLVFTALSVVGIILQEREVTDSEIESSFPGTTLNSDAL
jgi:hypothetical protein